MCRLRYNGIATGEVYVSDVSPRLSAHQAGAQSDGRRMEEFVNFVKIYKSSIAYAQTCGGSVWARRRHERNVA